MPLLFKMIESFKWNFASRFSIWSLLVATTLSAAAFFCVKKLAHTETTHSSNWEELCWVQDHVAQINQLFGRDCELLRLGKGNGTYCSIERGIEYPGTTGGEHFLVQIQLPVRLELHSKVVLRPALLTKVKKRGMRSGEMLFESFSNPFAWKLETHGDRQQIGELIVVDVGESTVTARLLLDLDLVERLQEVERRSFQFDDVIEFTVTEKTK